MKQHSSVQKGSKGPPSEPNAAENDTRNDRSREPNDTRSGRPSVIGSIKHKFRASRAQQSLSHIDNHRPPNKSARCNQQSMGPEPNNRGQINNAGSSRTEAGYIQTTKEKDTFTKELQADHIKPIQRHDVLTEKQHADYNWHNKEQEHDMKKLVQDKTNLEKELVKLRDKCHRLESVALTAQEGALKAMAKGGCVPKEDWLVRNELTKLRDGLRQWARRYTIGNIDDIGSVPRQQKDQVIRELKSYCVQINWNSLVSEVAIPPNKIPFVLVEALLAKDIFGQMFADPFFVFPETNDDSSLPVRAGMHLLYDTMRQVDQAGAHRWRSQTMSVLSSNMHSRLQEFTGRRAEDFVCSPAHVLLRAIGDETSLTRRNAELQKLYHGGGELALSLWTQRTFIECHGLSQLQTFDSSSPKMSAHRLHQLDEDEECLDGNRLLACIQPMVLAFGDEQGENYDTSKIWANAVVLVEAFE